MDHTPEDLNNIIAGISDKRELQQLIDDIKKVAPELAQGISMQLTVAMAKILAAGQIAEKEKEQAMLLSISNSIAATRNKMDLLEVLHGKLRTVFSFSHTVICILNSDKKTVRTFLLDPHSPNQQHPDYPRLTDEIFPISDSLLNVALHADTPVIFDGERLIRERKGSLCVRVNYDSGIREFLFVSLRNGEERIGFLMMCSAVPNEIDRHKLNLIQGIASQLSVAVASILANDELEKKMRAINSYKQQLEKEKWYLQEEINEVYNYQEIIGSSAALQQVYQRVSQVAKADSSVLILGETGTGKELLARAIHNQSYRKDQLMVKVNCAALSPNLIESELFGHERGSFTGATDRRIGKFELAAGGTLFLDEIGEMPLDLQVKLLRVLQEKEIERVGGKTVIPTDVRIIAATNRQLWEEVQAGRFRSDLYYRLNVFPVTIPPLRDRRKDIPALVDHFIAKYNRKTGKKISGVSAEVLSGLMAYSWPGNIRELEHLIERFVILTQDTFIQHIDIPVHNLVENPEPPTVASAEDARVRTIDEIEREHIVYVLKKCQGKVSGAGGAAELLQIPSTTLNSKMKRLNIHRRDFE
ncbi:Fis family transcriptional regulator [Niastella koreensis]|uniref:Sigma54 specific transcriptional regulator, Fis family n=2 Tax=Niastella koreensis TaxID=354356 RepID=G8T9D3_NIAKG|nr:sigma 54-interacting transcriptional regulator [Niastella koreensis]AEV98101.1 sigma54 specific transcriptional regulator, Fis family [Niastella koreensis GR20-10]OQP45312.1 Fis family transcriptional regulator [Niastella koreensis]